MNDSIQKKLDELVNQADLFIASPETIERLKSHGLPIKSTFTTYGEYLDKLFAEKRKNADELVKQLPHLDPSIANATISALYEELKETFVLGIPGAGITLSVILLELALKYRLFKERCNDDPNSTWEYIEQIDYTRTVSDLFKKGVVTKKERELLDSFNLDTRNPYIHYNIKKLVKDMVLGELTSVNAETGEVTVLKNVNPSEYPSIWFSAKKVRDKQSFITLVGISMYWVNKLLTEAKK